MCSSGLRTGIRNRALEQLLMSIDKIPCLQEGCNIKTHYSEMNKHYFNCNHREIRCPVINCKWTGKLIDINNHAYEQHFNDAIDIGNNDIKFIITNPNSIPIDGYTEKIIKYNGNFFLFSVWLVKKQAIPSSISFTIIELGTDKDTKWNLSIDNKRYNYKYSFESLPWSVTDNIYDLARSPYNFTMQLSTALYMGEDEPQFREFDLLHFEPKICSLNIPVTVKVANQEKSDEKTPETTVVNLELFAINDDDEDF
jgi:hypothetical protein